MTSTDSVINASYLPRHLNPRLVRFLTRLLCHILKFDFLLLGGVQPLQGIRLSVAENRRGP